MSRGVIAGGSLPTVEAGAEILRAGGNAIDAAVAACFATAVGEPTLTSLAGGGMLIFRDGQSGEASICDLFSDAPRKKLSTLENADFFPIDLDFGPTTQRFYVGAASAAVPTVLPGLCTALEKWGTLGLDRAIAPACRMMRDGVLLGEYQGRAAALLEPILTFTESGRNVFHIDGRMIRAGDRFKLPQLADTLEAMATQGWKNHYDGVLTPQMLEQFGPEHGGLLTREDFDSYEIIFREPLSLRYHHSRVLTPPPPAAGGTMIALMLRLLDSVDLGAHAPGSPEHVKLLSCAMTTADEARAEGIDAIGGGRIDHWLGRFKACCDADALPAAPTVAAPESTTHVSVIDAAGNAAAITFSYGEGNAHIIGNSGIMMNNLMGEEDLFPDGFDSAPCGSRLPTMMSPSILLADDGSLTVMGTGGANRIRTAIVQVISLLHDHHYEPRAAVDAPRVHYEAGVLNAEIFEMADGGEALEALRPASMVRFNEHSLFFGGVHMVSRSPDGSLHGAGDPRRGGACIVV